MDILHLSTIDEGLILSWYVPADIEVFTSKLLVLGKSLSLTVSVVVSLMSPQVYETASYGGGSTEYRTIWSVRSGLLNRV